MAIISIEWLVVTRETLHSCLHGTLDRYDNVSPFLKVPMTPWGHQLYIFLKKDDVLFNYQMVWPFLCAATLNELDMIPERKISGETWRKVQISVSDSLLGVLEC